MGLELHKISLLIYLLILFITTWHAHQFKIGKPKRPPRKIRRMIRYCRICLFYITTFWLLPLIFQVHSWLNYKTLKANHKNNFLQFFYFPVFHFWPTKFSSFFSDLGSKVPLLSTWANSSLHRLTTMIMTLWNSNL